MGQTGGRRREHFHPYRVCARKGKTPHKLDSGNSGQWIRSSEISFNTFGEKKKKGLGVPLWFSELRIWSCHCCGSGYSCGSGALALELSHAAGAARKTPKLLRSCQLKGMLRISNHTETPGPQVLNSLN